MKPTANSHKYPKLLNAERCSKKYWAIRELFKFEVLAPCGRHVNEVIWPYPLVCPWPDVTPKCLMWCRFGRLVTLRTLSGGSGGSSNGSGSGGESTGSHQRRPMAPPPYSDALNSDLSLSTAHSATPFPSFRYVKSRRKSSEIETAYHCFHHGYVPSILWMGTGPA